ncbi:MAG TPA: MFS transporter [Gemmataceae bacterium]|nr:MFS transporter [Gemmataceae bacterium]
MASDRADYDDQPNPAADSAPPLDVGVRMKLSIMMFLQFAIWGSWATVVGNYLDHLKFSKEDIGWIGSLMPLGGMVGPMLLIFSQLADRFVASEKLLGAFHLLGAGCLYWVSTITDAGQFWPMFAAMSAYALLYNATLALSNSITFTHVVGERDFPSIRVLGTIGWIAAGFALDYVLGSKEKPVHTGNTFLLMAVGLSAVLGVFCFFLPATPPSGRKGDALPFVKAFGLFKDPAFAVFFGVSFVITIVLAFYYSFTGLYLGKSHGVTNIASTMIWGQVAEIFFMLLLPWFLRTMGMKGVLTLGMLCWGLRYALFAFSAGKEELYSMAFVGILLHGICFDFFFAAAFIYVDKKAPPDIRPSAQALFTFLTYGAGMFIGNIVAGYLAGFLTTKTAEGAEVVDWQTFWLVPAVGVFVSMLAFVALFRNGRESR